MENITISQGLRALKRISGELATAKKRVENGSSWQKGKKPTYPFQESLEGYNQLSEEVVKLHSRIMRANTDTMVKDDKEEILLCQAILRLSEMKAKIALLKGLNLQSGDVEREARFNYRTDEQIPQSPLVYENALKERDRDGQVKELQEHFERLNDAVEKANHATTLPE